MRVLRFVLTIAALAAIGLALANAIEDAGGVALPGPGRLATSGLLLALGMMAAGAAWALLLPALPFRQVLPGFALAQLAKYVPGSIWQGVGQVADAHRLGVPVSAGTLAYLLQVLLQLLVAAAASAVAIVAPDLPTWLAVPAVIGPVGLVLLRRTWLDAVLQRLARLTPRVDPTHVRLPSQMTIVLTAGCAAVTILTIGASFAVLLPSADGARGFVATAGIFMLAWVIGFVVLPLPSGLGVREAVLVAGLASVHPVADVLAAAIVARLVLVVVELAFVALAQLARLDR